ncbi:VOC family protein [Litoribacter ruber]|uniref:VOC family protein n=1 Tax=Litoribacter ruber TaxID=702568 RepID=A0AAP2CGD0_9BACT|nr:MULTISPECIES: VOC family protein [Litoribacter]MBS9524143.1 VOC family protein [Litoribacter alkaliphilus]MBT0810058.1 VOC family protein [Litoribacter ruber]
MTNSYKIPSHTRIGHVHLKVSNLQRAMDFYCGLLGFELQQKFGEEAAFLSAGGYHHHIGLNVWFSKNASAAPRNAPGLFHTAILYPTRKDLAQIYQRIKETDYPFTGFADHGVSEALYLDDPDGNGVELYWDRPVEAWPKTSKGELDMYTRALDINSLLSAIES